MNEKSEEIIGMQDEEEHENTENEQWKKFPQLKILSIDFNQNNTLLVLSTNYGYRIFDVLNDFKLVSTVDENQKELGPLKKTKILYKSSLIGFVGDRDNKRFKENTFNHVCNIGHFWFTQHGQCGTFRFRRKSRRMFRRLSSATRTASRTR